MSDISKLFSETQTWSHNLRTLLGGEESFTILNLNERYRTIIGYKMWVVTLERIYTIQSKTRWKHRDFYIFVMQKKTASRSFSTIITH